MAENGRNVYLVKIGPKSPAHTRRDICKDKESNLGPVAGYSGWNYPELSYIFVSVQNSRWFCNLKGIFNVLNKVLCLASVMECAEGNNKIVLTGIPLRCSIRSCIPRQKQWSSFLGKNKTSTLDKTLWTYPNISSSIRSVIRPFLLRAR